MVGEEEAQLTGLSHSKQVKSISFSGGGWGWVGVSFPNRPSAPKTQSF